MNSDVFGPNYYVFATNWYVFGPNLYVFGPKLDQSETTRQGLGQSETRCRGLDQSETRCRGLDQSEEKYCTRHRRLQLLKEIRYYYHMFLGFTELNWIYDCFFSSNFQEEIADGLGRVQGGRLLRRLRRDRLHRGQREQLLRRLQLLPRNERPQLRPHAWGLHAKWSAGTALPDAETREESRAEGADS